jgi:hypothetical protein
MFPPRRWIVAGSTGDFCLARNDAMLRLDGSDRGCWCKRQTEHDQATSYWFRGVLRPAPWASIFLLAGSNTGLQSTGLGVLRLWTAHFHWMGSVLPEQLREAYVVGVKRLFYINNSVLDLPTPSCLNNLGKCRRVLILDSCRLQQFYDFQV